MNKLTLNQMQEMLPDYAFDRLKEHDQKVFEYNLNEYPEIESELNEIRAVFENAELFDFDAMMKENSKNLSFKVQEELSDSTKKRNSFLSFKIAIPTLAILFMAYLTFFEGIFSVESQRSSNQVVSSDLISEDELSIIFEDSEIDYDGYLYQTEASEYSSFRNMKLSDELNYEFISEIDFNETEISDLQPFLDTQAILESLSEDEFLELIRKIQSEKFDV